MCLRSRLTGKHVTGEVAKRAELDGGGTDYEILFSTPLWVTVVVLAVLLALYPKRSPKAPAGG